MAESDIEWLRCPCCGRKGYVWNPVTGCDTVSPGCENCYARSLANRWKAAGQPRYQTDGHPVTSGPGFGIQEHPDLLTLPLSWRTHRRVFPTSMSDLFHPRVSDDFIARAFATMALTARHTYVSTTKRAPRMAALLSRPSFVDAVAEHATDLISSHPWKRWQLDLGGERLAGDSGLGGGWTVTQTASGNEWRPPWPLPNVWLGVSVEDQQRADERIPRLLATPAAVRWISAEPLLELIRLDPHWLTLPHALDDTLPMPARAKLSAQRREAAKADLAAAGILKGHLDWVVVGGESGHRARPMEPAWARSLRDQAVEAGVPFFMKQWGAWAPNGYRGIGATERISRGRERQVGEPVDQLGHREIIERVGGHGGRELDGRIWDESPPAPVAA